MKIREKFFLAFGLYILLAVASVYLAYTELRSISKRLGFLEAADDVTITTLEARRHEKNFLLYKDKDELPALKEQLGILRKDVEDIRPEIIKETGAASYDDLRKTISEYEGWVDKVVSNRDAQERQVELVKEKGRRVEKRLTGKRLEAFLVLRRYEKNLMLYRDRETYETFRGECNIPVLGCSGDVGEYSDLVKGLYALYQEENLFVEKMRSDAREIQSFTVKLARAERSGITTTLNTAYLILLISLFVIVSLGIVVNIKLSRGIAAPLRALEKVSKKIAQGDFSEAVEVRGRDELASLETAFNYMEERLKEALASLESTISQLREKQAQLVEAEKHASVGILAAGVAHEINNPLTAVLTFSNLMLEQTPKDDPRHERLKLITKETHRARHIVKQLMGFAKESPPLLARKNLNQPIRDIIDSLVAQGELDDVDLHLDLADDLPLAMADCGQIGQVVLNLVMNAIHSITPPGTIEVSSRAKDGNVEIEVRDTGCGIPAEHLGRVFDTFFTTKQKGTGLGLAVSYGIVKRHGGDIEVRSEVGKGSTFTVRIPINANA